LSRTRRLQNLGCLSMREFLITDLVESMSILFFTPNAQWIMVFISGSRNSLPAGVTGSTESLSGGAIARGGGGGLEFSLVGKWRF
jgi:hypothetical protein